MNGAAKIILDTNAVIREINEGQIASGKRPDLLEAELYISQIVRIELLAKPELPYDEETKIRAFLQNVVVMPINDDIENETIALRRKYKKLKLPDAIIAATAIKLGAILVTEDDHFDGITWAGFEIREHL